MSELVRKREDRYTPLIEHMREHGADLSLVAKAMRERDVEPALRRHVTEQLRA